MKTIVIAFGLLMSFLFGMLFERFVSYYSYEEKIVTKEMCEEIKKGHEENGTNGRGELVYVGYNGIGYANNACYYIKDYADTQSTVHEVDYEQYKKFMENINITKEIRNLRFNPNEK
jgi:hypothetical protein